MLTVDSRGTIVRPYRPAASVLTLNAVVRSRQIVACLCTTHSVVQGKNCRSAEGRCKYCSACTCRTSSWNICRLCGGTHQTALCHYVSTMSFFGAMHRDSSFLLQGSVGSCTHIPQPYTCYFRPSTHLEFLKRRTFLSSGPHEFPTYHDWARRGGCTYSFSSVSPLKTAIGDTESVPFTKSNLPYRILVTFSFFLYYV